MICAAPVDHFGIHDLLSQAMLKPEVQVRVCHPTALSMLMSATHVTKEIILMFMVCATS